MAYVNLPAQPQQGERKAPGPQGSEPIITNLLKMWQRKICHRTTVGQVLQVYPILKLIYIKTGLKLDNKPIGDQVRAYDGPRHGSDEVLSYDCIYFLSHVARRKFANGYTGFMPTGETYEFLPCAPYNGAKDILGFKQVNGVDTIMKRYGDYNAETVRTFHSANLVLDELTVARETLCHTNCSSIAAASTTSQKRTTSIVSYTWHRLRVATPW